jgi:hypothetical protein
MKSSILSLLLVAALTSGAMATVLPALTPLPAGVATITPVSGGFSLAAPYPSTIIPYAAGVAVVPAPLVNDYQLSTVLHFDMTQPTELGLLARVNPSTGAGYLASLNPSNGYLSLGGIVPAQQIPAEFNFDPANKDYKLEFTVNGSSLTASVYDGPTSILTMHGSDSALTSGLIGVIDLFPGNVGTSLSGTFLNSSVNSVPEPSVIGMLVSGIAVVLGWVGLRGRKRHQASSS